jgi:hypothetical protein
MPLTYAGRVGVEEPARGSREHARKIKPQYARGELRKVTTASQQAEAELIQMLLLEEGVPSTTRRSAGFDVPDFLAAGPRDVMVPESGLELAREVLRQADVARASTAVVRPVTPAALLIGIVVALGVIALLAWVVIATQ